MTELAGRVKLPFGLSAAFVLLASLPGLGNESLKVDPEPSNTVLVASRVEGQFSRDFSPLLKGLRCQWCIVEDGDIPKSVREMNVVLIGRQGVPGTDEIMRQVLTTEELQNLRTAKKPICIQKDSPWADGRTLFICSGSDSLQVRDAAEQTMRSLIKNSPPASDWVRSRFSAPMDQELRDEVNRLRFSWEDTELPLADLTIDLKAKPPRQISSHEAGEDVKRLFYLFSHGYSGYAYFNEHHEFRQAEERIREGLALRPTWSVTDFSQLLHEHLGFIVDCHLNIGDIAYGGHVDFWYDSSLEFVLEEGGYQFVDEEQLHTLVSINGKDPGSFVFPSLNMQGEAIYRLGMLSKVKPGPLALVASTATGKRSMKVHLRRSDYEYYSRNIFREDRVGGIPVIRVRSFGDVAEKQLHQFVLTAFAHRGDPVVIVDIRGNQGGNETWPVQWIHGLTGERANSVFAFSELHCKTTMAGRANLFADLFDHHSNIAGFPGRCGATYQSGQAFRGWEKSA